MTGSSVALATPNANNKKVQRAVLIISRRFHFNADKIEMFSEVEIEILYDGSFLFLCLFCFVLFVFFDVALLPKSILKYYALHFC